MKLDIDKIELKNINQNIYKISYDNNNLKFWTPKILIPFGLENEYDKYIIKLELTDNPEHEHLKKLILHIEKLIKKKMNIDEEHQFKSIIKKRDNKSDMIECRIRNIKNNIITSIEYEDQDNNYLKTIYDLPKFSNIKVQFEINGLWDYRSEKNEKNKVGLIVYANKIIVLK
jgi:hypothetical protein